jgi:hypothetical protein
MQVKSYQNDLLPLIRSLCGVEFAGIELPRIRALVNRRMKRAYRASNYWTRFLRIAEERNVVNGIVGFTQSGLDPVDTFLRIHMTYPYGSTPSPEYDFMVASTGAQLLAGNTSPDKAWVTYKSALSGVVGQSTDIVPDEWFEYIAHGTYSDFLRAEGQQEKAALSDAEAFEILQDELIKLDEQVTNQIISNRVRTVANTQLRYS